MSELGAAFTVGITAFVATNIDDIIILLLFFSQVDAKFHCRHIVIGQYLGFSLLIVASLPGFFGGLVVPSKWIGLLGVLPIAIGLKQLVNRQQDTAQVQTVTSDFEPSSPSNPIVSLLSSVLSPQTYQVAAVTVANGGDNISIYIPIFAGSNVVRLAVILGVFFFMVGVWCAIAYGLTRQPTLAQILSRYGNAVVPFVLIGLGLYILYERGTINALLKSLGFSITAF